MFRSTLSHPKTFAQTCQDICQVIYKAHGSNASWEWLVMIAPCIEILQKLARQMNQDLGDKQGTKHQSPDLSEDIQTLMNSLAEREVYTCKPGRVIHRDNAIIPNVVNVGLSSIPASVGEFNQKFKQQQARRRVAPLLGPVLSITKASGITQHLPALNQLPQNLTSLQLDTAKVPNQRIHRAGILEGSDTEELMVSSESSSEEEYDEAEDTEESEDEDWLPGRETDEDVAFDDDDDGFFYHDNASDESSL
ncbi:hypothetical protein ABKN59_001421 [Abortiporus biennis]